MGGTEQPAPSAKRPPRPRRRPRQEPYHPPFRQRRLDAAQAAKSTTDTVIQSRDWTRMKKHINGVINRVNQHNVAHCALDLFRVNIVRGRGVLCKALLRAQLASPSLSPVFAALVAIIGSRMPFLAELLVRRLVAQLKAAYTNQDRVLCFATARFIAQLFNQQVVNELLLLEFLSTCMLDPSDGSVELAVVTLNECAVLLMEKSPKALEVVFQRIRELLHDGDLSRRAQVMIENLMNMRRTKFPNADVLQPHLDLLEEEDVITHFVSLEDEDDCDMQYESDEFQFDPQYEANEKEYELIKRDILGAALHGPSQDRPTQKEGGEQEKEEIRDTSTKTDEEGKRVAEKAIDMTEADLVDFRRTIYLTFSSGLSYEEWAHKLLRLISSNKGKEAELCKMIVECCSQEKTYMRSYGLLGQRFCRLEKVYRDKFEDLFANHYATIHHFDRRKIRNIANFFASLLASDVLPWTLLQVVRIVEEETTALSRIFLKILFQEIWRTLGEPKTKERFKLAASEGHLVGVFPTDTAENARFSINFFSSIGLEFLTPELREKVKTMSGMNSNAQDGEESESSSSLSSESGASSVLSTTSNEENDLSQAEEPLPSKADKGRLSHHEGRRPNGTPSKGTENENERERETALDGREISVKGSPHTSSFNYDGGVHPHADNENNQTAYANASSVSGAKRVAQRRTDVTEDQSSHARKRRRYYSPQRRKKYRDRKEHRRYDSSDDEEYRRHEGNRYVRQRSSAERDADVRRSSRSPYRYRRRRRRSSSSRERRRRPPKYGEHSDSDFSRERYTTTRSRPSKDSYRSRRRYGSSSESSDEEPPSRTGSRSLNNHRRDRGLGRPSGSASRFDSDNVYHRDSADGSDDRVRSRERKDSPHSIARSSPDRRDIRA